MSVRYCQKCVYPATRASRLTFDADGVCSGCRTAAEGRAIDWNHRKKMLRELVDRHRGKDRYDIVVPVSGGKDSYYQTHYAIHELGLKPLLVTYHGNNYLPEGEANLHRMRDVFNCDHIIFRPSTEVLIKLNRVGFLVHGDMNLHCHMGIQTYPVQTAVRHGVPLMLWGEHGSLNISGMFSLNDLVEYTAKYRLEHSQHGFDWDIFTDEGLEAHGRPDLKHGVGRKDLLWAQMVTDDQVADLGLRGLYLGNFVDWDANEHVQLVKQKYGWQAADQEFERTYRKFSNLDDMHENGAHDYLKFIKFGYGRASDHASKDIRGGKMSREEGIRMVQKYDHVKPRKDLTRWLRYVGMSEDEFDAVCDTFRDPAVWRIEDGQWVKDNIWGAPSSYGPVHPRVLAARTREKCA